MGGKVGGKVGGMGKGGKGKAGSGKGKKAPLSRAARAGLQFPVGRVHRMLKSRISSEGEDKLGLPSEGAVLCACVVAYLPVDFVLHSSWLEHHAFCIC